MECVVKCLRKALLPVLSLLMLVALPAVTIAPDLQAQEVSTRTIKGVVTDSDGLPIIGANVVEVGDKSNGVVTDADGAFTLTIKKGASIRVTFIGFSEQVVSTAGKESFTIVLEEDAELLEGVVVTGLVQYRKESFTGSSLSFSGEELKQMAPSNVIEALALVTPGMEVAQSAAVGNNPNHIPDLLVRGVTSFGGGNNQMINQPLIVRDGTIITMQDLYDMDINEIESITVLKDASAAALYGAKAANGVIVIERKQIDEGPIRVMYNFTGGVELPDFSDYNLLNAEQKLEYERLAGLYDGETLEEQYELDELYNRRYKEIRRGVYTDWMAKPSRVGTSHEHSLRISGGSKGTRYEVQGRFADTRGVMKGDYRKRYGIGFTLEHYAPYGITFSNKTNLSRVDSKKSPYGSFSTYAKMNPYDRVVDEYGQYIKVLSWDKTNPLYDASLGSYNETGSMVLSNDFDARWTINDHLRLTTHWNLSVTGDNAEEFVSPLDGEFKDEPSLLKRGRMTQSSGKGISYSGNAILSYNYITPDHSLLTLNLGGNLSHSDYRDSRFNAVGFLSDDLSFINFAASYPDASKPIGSQTLSADVGAFLNGNFSYRDRYYVDGVLQVSGSSKFGANNRYAPFWSMGLGWNLHNESFVNPEVINLMKLRASMGYTGKVSFEPYQALTTYQYSNDLTYLNGVGTMPMTIGNPDLTWEKTMNYNIGLDLSFFDHRLNITGDLYLRRTTDLVIDKSVAPSTGVTSTKDNLGKMENRGFELRADGYLIRNSRAYLLLGASMTHNRNKILEISNALESQNELNNTVVSLAPLPQYQEGESTTALKVVRSAGIDPATGQEIYIKRNGDRTFEYDPADKVNVGDTSPLLSGSLYTNFGIGRLTASVYFSYRLGGLVYNTTRASKVEGADPRDNADVRVLSDRWKEPGDVVRYKDISDQSMPKQTTRFVEKENTLSLSRLSIAYELDESWAKKLGAAKLSIGLGTNDLLRFSTVRMERGTEYLYSRGIDLSLVAVF